jgi:signal transduction histidine kinase
MTVGQRMPSPFAVALRESYDRLSAIAPADAKERVLARRVLREMEEAVSRLEGGEPVADLVSIICHDLKDPLASIVMGAGFLKKSTSATAEEAKDGAVRRVVEAITRSTDRMGQIIADFHDLARLETGRVDLDLHAWDVAPLLRETADRLGPQARERRLGVGVEVPDEPLIASCDRGRVLQVLSKLVGNAIKFTPPADGSARILLRATLGGDVVRVEVIDTGRGIAAERLPAIFDYASNARRAPRDGPGLGLAIARGLVELHGGRIDVESHTGPGQAGAQAATGSTFTFTLPRHLN